MSIVIPPFLPVPEHQADALVTMDGGTPPVSGTKYEWSSTGAVAGALGTQKNVRLIALAIKCVWTVQPDPLEIHFTIDGVTFLMSKSNPVSDTWYYPTLTGAAADLAADTTDYALRRAFLLGGREVKVEAEVTGGTVSALYLRVKWAKW